MRNRWGERGRCRKVPRSFGKEVQKLKKKKKIRSRLRPDVSLFS